MFMLRTCVSCQPYLKFLSPIAERYIYTSTHYACLSKLAKIRDKPRSVQPFPPNPKHNIEPFVKNLFVGKVDGDLLAYPELDLSRCQVLNDMAAEIEDFMNSVDSRSINSQRKIPEEVMSGLKNLGMFGLSIPTQYGGLGFSMIEMTRLFEALGSDSSLFYTLNSHHSQVVETLLSFGNEEQKQEYLPRLASGDLICGLALWEKEAGTDLTKMTCAATQVDDAYILHGSKCWVSNAGIADMFLVFAKNNSTDSSHLADSVTCFLVDRHSSGIKTKLMETVGVKGFDLWEMTFERTPVSAKNIVGKVESGMLVALNIVNSRHTFLASAAPTILKKLLDTTTRHVINRDVFHCQLKDYELVKQSLAQVAQRIYTMESMAYFTAGILDDAEDPDTRAEAAIMKVYSAESLVWGIRKCFSLLGSQSYLEDFPYEQILRDAHFALIAEGTSDPLRLVVAMLGLKHVVDVDGDLVKKMRNPRENPEFTLASAWKKLFRSGKDEIELDNEIIHHLHPSMNMSAAYFDYCVRKLERLSREMLVKWGSDFPKKGMELIRLADIAIECYTVAAVISRASRSYCLGLRQCDEELLMSQSVAYDALQRVNELATALTNSPYLNNDGNYLVIADKIINAKGYKMSHPLTRAY